MARNINEILTQMIAAKESDQNLSGLTSNSVFAIWRLLFFVVAAAIWTLERLFDIHSNEVDEKVRNQRAHTIGWYRTTALNFQFGGILKDDITEYDNTGLTDEEVAAQKIITKCSVTKVTDAFKPALLIKVNKAEGALNDEERGAFAAYMEAMADGGVNLSIVSENPDRLVLYAIVRYDGLVLNAAGAKFLDGSRPVDEGITAHLNNLIWNGTFYPSQLEQYLMNIPSSGIRVATVTGAQASYLSGSLRGIADKYEPYSGAIECDIETDLHVTYERF